MKTSLLEWLICPVCLPREFRLDEHILDSDGDDIVEGHLRCPQCDRVYAIQNGVADLDPNPATPAEQQTNKYETEAVVSSYLWSHYADLLKEENASEAYSHWSNLMQPHEGLALDAGAAVGRFTFEMGAKCDFAVGFDNSHAFIQIAREMMNLGRMNLALKQEGNITREVELKLPSAWNGENVEFVVADALALPFRDGCARSFSSLNLVDKVPRPLLHLEEMNRVIQATGVQFLLSDPFSWSPEAAEETEWLGGKTSGTYAGRGLDNVVALLTQGRNRLAPKWRVDARGHVWWKIRTHENHFEQIRSCYIKAGR